MYASHVGYEVQSDRAMSHIKCETHTKSANSHLASGAHEQVASHGVYENQERFAKSHLFAEPHKISAGVSHYKIETQLKNASHRSGEVREVCASHDAYEIQNTGAISHDTTETHPLSAKESHGEYEAQINRASQIKSETRDVGAMSQYKFETHEKYASQKKL